MLPVGAARGQRIYKTSTGQMHMGMLHYNVQVDLRCPFLVFGMKKNDFTAAFMNSIADGKLWLYAINKPNGFAIVTCIQ